MKIPFIQPQSKLRSPRLLLMIGLTVVAGTAVLMAIFAAGSFVAVEAETAVPSGNAKIVAAAGASGGKAVQFGANAPAPTAAPGPTPVPSAAMRPLPDPLYGVTADDVSNTANLINSSKNLAHKPTTRIVFDENTTPANYTAAIAALQPSTYLMGEISDSEYMKKLSVQQYHDRTAQFLQAFSSQVDLWEVGNEVNGNWTGTYSDVSAKISDAYNQVAAAGRRSELTLWYNPGCPSSSSELDPVTFSNTYVPAAMKNGLNYVLISYYETQCNNYRPTPATLTTLFTQLHAIYPNAKLGFGEIGLPDAATSSTLAKAQSIASYYYGLKLNLPYYVGGYFYWYYYEDALPYTSKPMWQTINAGIASY